MALVADEHSIWLQLQDLFDTLGDDYAQMRDGVDEAEYALIEMAGSYEEYFRLKGLPMPTRQ